MFTKTARKSTPTTTGSNLYEDEADTWLIPEVQPDTPKMRVLDWSKDREKIQKVYATQRCITISSSGGVFHERVKSDKSKDYYQVVGHDDYVRPIRSYVVDCDELHETQGWQLLWTMLRLVGHQLYALRIETPRNYEKAIGPSHINEDSLLVLDLSNPYEVEHGCNVISSMLRKPWSNLQALRIVYDRDYDEYIYPVNNWKIPKTLKRVRLELYHLSTIELIHVFNLLGGLPLIELSLDISCCRPSDSQHVPNMKKAWLAAIHSWTTTMERISLDYNYRHHEMFKCTVTINALVRIPHVKTRVSGVVEVVELINRCAQASSSVIALALHTGAPFAPFAPFNNSHYHVALSELNPCLPYNVYSPNLVSVSTHNIGYDLARGLSNSSHCACKDCEERVKDCNDVMVPMMRNNLRLRMWRKVCIVARVMCLPERSAIRDSICTSLLHPIEKLLHSPVDNIPVTGFGEYYDRVQQKTKKRMEKFNTKDVVFVYPFMECLAMYPSHVRNIPVQLTPVQMDVVQRIIMPGAGQQQQALKPTTRRRKR